VRRDRLPRRLACLDQRQARGRSRADPGLGPLHAGRLHRARGRPGARPLPMGERTDGPGRLLGPGRAGREIDHPRPDEAGDVDHGAQRGGGDSGHLQAVLSRDAGRRHLRTSRRHRLRWDGPATGPRAGARGRPPARVAHSGGHPHAAALLAEGWRPNGSRQRRNRRQDVEIGPVHVDHPAGALRGDRRAYRRGVLPRKAGRGESDRGTGGVRDPPVARIDRDPSGGEVRRTPHVPGFGRLPGRVGGRKAPPSGPEGGRGGRARPADRTGPSPLY